MIGLTDNGDSVLARADEGRVPCDDGCERFPRLSQRVHGSDESGARQDAQDEAEEREEAEDGRGDLARRPPLCAHHHQHPHGLRDLHQLLHVAAGARTRLPESVLSHLLYVASNLGQVVTNDNKIVMGSSFE